MHKLDNFIFYSDKDVAKSDKCYIYDKKDKGGKSKGSIICTRLPILINDEIVAQIILSISTYGFKICERKQESDVGEIIEKILLKRFFKRIRVELIHMYIRSK